MMMNTWWTHDDNPYKLRFLSFRRNPPSTSGHLQCHRVGDTFANTSRKSDQLHLPTLLPNKNPPVGTPTKTHKNKRKNHTQYPLPPVKTHGDMTGVLVVRCEPKPTWSCLARFEERSGSCISVLNCKELGFTWYGSVPWDSYMYPSMNGWFYLENLVTYIGKYIMEIYQSHGCSGRVSEWIWEIAWYIFICSSTHGYITYGKNMEKKPKQKLQGYSRFRTFFDRAFWILFFSTFFSSTSSQYLLKDWLSGYNREGNHCVLTAGGFLFFWGGGMVFVTRWFLDGLRTWFQTSRFRMNWGGPKRLTRTRTATVSTWATSENSLNKK